MKRSFLLLLGCINILACTSNSENKIAPSKDYTQFVNPFIGTSQMGHVFPGATLTFEMSDQPNL